MGVLKTSPWDLELLGKGRREVMIKVVQEADSPTPAVCTLNR